MTKPQTYFLIIALFFIGFLIFFFSPGKKANESGRKNEEAKQEKPIEIFSMAGVVSEVNEKESYLLVKRSGSDSAVKVVLNGETEVIQLEFPFDVKNPPKEASFTPVRAPIEIGDLEEGDNILIETDINIYGKTEFDNVRRIQALP